VQYTLATKLTSTWSTLLIVDCCRNRQQIGNKVDCSDTVNFVANTVDFVAIRSTLLLVLATNRQQLEFDSLSRWTLLPIWWTLSPATRSTFNKVAPQSWIQHGRLSTKSTVLNSTLSPVCTGLKTTARPPAVIWWPHSSLGVVDLPTMWTIPFCTGIDSPVYVGTGMDLPAQTACWIWPVWLSQFPTVSCQQRLTLQASPCWLGTAGNLGTDKVTLGCKSNQN